MWIFACVTLCPITNVIPTRRAAFWPESLWKAPRNGEGQGQSTHLVRQLEEPAAGDIHIIVRSVAMVIGWLAGFGATSSSLWGPHT